MKIKLEMSESDIIRSIKNKKYSPIHVLCAKHFKESVDNVDVNLDSIVLWNDDINDYKSYRYCVEDINKIEIFLNEWNDFIDNYIDDFCLDPISFCIESAK